MRHRAVPRLVLLCAVAAGVLTLAVHLDARQQPARVDPAAAVTSPRMELVALNESRPHDHVVDPETGGLVSVAPALGVLPGAARLGPVHVDPLPPGVHLSSSTRTGALLDRAARQQVADAAVGQPFGASATAPLGTPGIRTLSSHVAPSCTGTGQDGNRVQVLYAHEGASRFSSVRTLLRNEVANVDDVFALSARQTGGERRVRWVRDAACLPVIKDVTMPRGTLGKDFFGTVNALRKKGYDDPRRKYLVFADTNQFCGMGTQYDDPRASGNDNDGRYASYARIDANCWSTGQSIAAHELIHTLGGVQANAPHATRNGHCYDESDLMCYDDGSKTAMRKVCASAEEQLLDCRNDDYFHTAPAPGSYLARSWNTARSSFLDVLSPTPDVTVSGSRTAAQTGDQVTFTATSSREVAWSWSSSSAACALTPRTSGRAVLVCPSTVTGSVVVTAKATEAGSLATRARTAAVTLTRAAAPTATVVAPSTPVAGSTFGVSVSPVGKAPYTYAWRAGTCTVPAPSAATATVLCPPSARPGDVAVTVVVGQADGQTRTASRTVQLR